GGRRRGENGWEELDTSDLARLAADDVPGWHVPWREPTGFPAGRPRVPVDELETIKAGLLDVVGPVEWVRSLTRHGGRLTGPALESRRELERRLAAVLHDGRRRGTIKALEELYGLSRVTIHRLA